MKPQDKIDAGVSFSGYIKDCEIMVFQTLEGVGITF